MGYDHLFQNINDLNKANVLAPRRPVKPTKVEVLSKEEYALDLLHKMQTYIKTHQKRNIQDFQQFYTPSDNFWGETRSGGNTRPNFSDLECFADQTCGFGHKLTKEVADDATRNGFELIDYSSKVVPKPQIFKWCVKSDFNNQLSELLREERTFGTAFLMKYWSSNDKYETPPPKKPPLKFQAFSPVTLTPTNLTDTNLLDYDEEVWEFQGGHVNNVQIHRDRIEVLCTRPLHHSWLGLSIFEPIYLSSSGYLNLIINGMKMMSKYGNVVTSFTMAEENPSLEMYQEYEDLINEFKAAYTFILGQGEEIQFQDTKIASGLHEFAEFLKEDISSGSGYPMNALWGRAVSGGIGGEGALTAERAKIQYLSNVQSNMSDDVWRIIRNSGWNIENLMVRFRLDLQKTERAKLEERALELQNYILEEQLAQMQLQTYTQALQLQQMTEAADNPMALEGVQFPMLDDKSNDNGNDKNNNQGNQNKKPGLSEMIKQQKDLVEFNFKRIRDLNKTLRGYRN